MALLQGNCIDPSEINSDKGIKVFVRIRPLIGEEKSLSNTIFEVEENNQIVWKQGQSKDKLETKIKNFVFDGVATESVNQAAFFHNCGASVIVQKVLQGYNATIFAYGQTGSGKTFTMEGFRYADRAVQKGKHQPQADFEQTSPEDAGLTPRCLKNLFEGVDQLSREEPDAEYEVLCSYLQIYNERIYDLLAGVKGVPSLRGKKGVANAAQEGLKLRWSVEREFFVEGLLRLTCSSAADALNHFQEGVSNKVMAQHRLNAASSRSHCIFIVDISKRKKDGEVFRSRLNLVDLAGSERASKTGATGVTLQESIGINQSLFVLRKVIQALSEQSNNQGSNKGRDVVPYRDSKLTSLLKNSLGGNAFTVMIACLAPIDGYADENLNTLNYASQAKAIKNLPRINLDAKSQLIEKLKVEINDLKRQLKATQEALIACQARLQATDRGEQTGANAVEAESNPICTTVEAPIKSASELLESNVPKDVRQKKQAAAASEKNITNRELMQIQALMKKEIEDTTLLIKQMVHTEQALREQIEQQARLLTQAESEAFTLGRENTSLREKIELLEYLVSCGDTASGEVPARDPFSYLDGKGESINIPGYGEINQKPGTVLSGSSNEMLQKQVVRLQYENDLLNKELEQLRQTSNNQFESGIKALSQQLKEASVSRKEDKLKKIKRIHRSSNQPEDTTISRIKSQPELVLVTKNEPAPTKMTNSAPNLPESQGAGLLSAGDLQTLLGVGKKEPKAYQMPRKAPRGSRIPVNFKPAKDQPPPANSGINQYFPSAINRNHSAQGRKDRGSIINSQSNSNPIVTKSKPTDKINHHLQNLNVLTNSTHHSTKMSPVSFAGALLVGDNLLQNRQSPNYENVTQTTSAENSSNPNKSGLSLKDGSGLISEKMNSNVKIKNSTLTFHQDDEEEERMFQHFSSKLKL